MIKHILLIFSFIFAFLGTSNSSADSVRVAVASNFSHTLKLLASDFHSSTGHTVKVSSASTGKLFTQIMHGAPFDIFMSADEKRANLLIQSGKTKKELSLVYAIGKLALLSNIQPNQQCRDVLSSNNIKYFAIANPKTAPYGAAAKQVLQQLNQWSTLEKKLVLGENIAQTMQFVSTGSASAGLVALSLLTRNNKLKNACTWHVPSNMHDPIKQKMVVLSKSKDKIAAKAFWKYMQSMDALNIVKKSGYDIII